VFFAFIFGTHEIEIMSILNIDYYTYLDLDPLIATEPIKSCKTQIQIQQKLENTRFRGARSSCWRLL